MDNLVLAEIITRQLDRLFNEEAKDIHTASLILITDQAQLKQFPSMNITCMWSAK
jgi:hypothetical protein